MKPTVTTKKRRMKDGAVISYAQQLAFDALPEKEQRKLLLRSLKESKEWEQ